MTKITFKPLEAKLLGLKVLVRLLKWEEIEVEKTNSILSEPPVLAGMTDGGRPDFKIRDFAKTYSNIAEVIQIPSAAKKKLKELEDDVAVGDHVQLVEHAINHANHYYTRIDENRYFDGHLRVTLDQMQSIYKNN